MLNLEPRSHRTAAAASNIILFLEMEIQLHPLIIVQKISIPVIKLERKINDGM